MIGDKIESPKTATTFIAYLNFLSFPEKIFPGYSSLVKFSHLSVACKITKFIQKIDLQTGKVTE